MNLNENARRRFKKAIWDYYKNHKRDFPWRKTADPYKIMVSEIMLQQTQADRVVKKYNSWLKCFPNLRALAEAPLRDVLKEWKGLGYNRRALALKRSAEEIVDNRGGIFPKTYEDILSLPGIGPYTAGAIMAFAWNKPVPIIETNIRAVYIYFFLAFHDHDILALVEKTLDKKNPRDWYHALMDYGAMLKKTVGNPNRKSAHYAKQSSFKGSNREIRSNILTIITESPQTLKSVGSKLVRQLPDVNQDQIEKNIRDFVKEGFIVERKNRFFIVS